MRIVVSGGGTAGHISPALATSDALKRLDSTVELLYVGQAGGMEAKIVAAQGMKFAAIAAGKFRRDHFASTAAKVLNLHTVGPNARDLVRTVRGLADSLKILRRYKPAVVFIKGGYVGLPVGLAAAILRIPYVIHESDVSPGLANRILGRWAAKIAVGFPVKSYRDFDPHRLVFVGNPVRREVAAAHRLEGLAHFKLDDRLPVVLVTGGSLGAAQINAVVLEALSDLVSWCQVIHQTGEHDFEHVQFQVRRLGVVKHLERYQVRAFLTQDMALAIAAADVVVSRAGSNAIAELATQGKPTILIPNYQMAGHQMENARVLSRAGAARVLDGSSLTGVRLVQELRRVIGDSEEQERLSKAIRQFARPDAAQDLAEVILDLGRTGERSDQKPNIEAET